MFFKGLSKEIQEAVRKLTTDAVFQQRFGEDKILDELEAEQFDMKACLIELQSTLGHKIKCGTHTFSQITPAAWSWLWSIENPFVKKTAKEPTLADADLFLYVIDHGVSEDIVDTATKAMGYCAKIGLSEEAVSEVIHQLVTRAFTPLKLFPNMNQEGEGTEPLFDADWLTSLVSRVHSVTGYLPETIMNKLSMTACCFYHIQYARMNTTQRIERRPLEEILKAQDYRACELICDRLVELAVIKPEECEEILKKISTPPSEINSSDSDVEK
jgi:hypothetical protein